MSFSNKLSSCYVDPTSKTTHVCMGTRKGRFYIGDDSVLESYYDEIYKGNETVASMGLAEVPGKDMDYSPVRVDIDLCKTYKKDDLPEAIYDIESVTTLVAIYYKKIQAMVCGGLKDRDCMCVYLAKDKPKRKDPNTISQGFHLHFPFIFLRNGDQKNFLHPQIEVEVDNLGLFDDVVDADKKSSSAVDARACIGAPWLMYGSGKGDGRYYKIFDIWDANMKSVSIESMVKRYFNREDDEEYSFQKPIKWYIPRILSIDPVDRDVYSLAPSAYGSIKYEASKKRYLPKNCNVEDFTDVEEIEKDCKLAQELVPLLSEERADDWMTWTRVGIYLFNITKGGEVGFNLWYTFSQSAKNARIATEDECRKIWSNFYDSGITIRALENMVKEDNKEEYSKYQKRNSHRHIIHVRTINNYDVAMTLHALFPEEFVYTRDKTWFVFRNHSWHFAPEGMFIRKLLSTTLCDNHKSLSNKIKEILKIPGLSQDKQETLTLALENVSKILNALKSTSYKNNIMKELAELYYDPNFLQKLDADPDLLCFDNGVFDLKEGIFRDGRPSDYTSKTTCYDYVEFDPKSKRVLEVMAYLEQVFPDSEVREYALNFMSDLVRGFNFNKIFSIWTGNGDNSKSVLINLLEKVFGAYFVKLPTSLVTGKRTQSSAAAPELSRTKGVRICVLQEPSKNDNLNAGIVKELTGNDSFYCRGLFSDGGDVTPLFKLVMACNDLPDCSNSDDAYWNRIRVLPFESTFSNNAPKDLQSQVRTKTFPKDPNFSIKLNSMVQPLIYLLVNRYSKMRNKKYFEPYKVTCATDIYKRNNNVALLFTNERVVEDKDNLVSILDLYTEFKEWHKDSYPGRSTPTKSDLQEKLNKLWKDCAVNAQKNQWKGYRIRNIQDDMKDVEEFEKRKKEKEEEEEKEEIYTPNNEESGYLPNTIIVGKDGFTYLVGFDREITAKITVMGTKITFIEDRVGNPIRDGVVFDKNSPSEEIGDVIGDDKMAYITYRDFERDEIESYNSAVVICPNKKKSEWKDYDFIGECAEVDELVDINRRKKIEKKVASMNKRIVESSNNKKSPPGGVQIVDDDVDDGDESEVIEYLSGDESY